MKNKDPHPKGRVVNDAIVVFGIDNCIVDPATNELIPIGVEMVKHHIEAGDFIIFTTERTFDQADATSKSIQDVFDILPFHDFTILMKRTDDPRPRIELKREFAQFVGQYAMKDQLEIPAMFDSDKDVVASWLQMGFPAKVLNIRTGTDQADVIPEAELPPPPLITAANAAALAAFFPDGVLLKNAEDHTRYQMFGVFLASTARFAMSGFNDKMALREMAEMVKLFDR